MSILLFRIDERLIHGQVVLGWGSHLRPERYLVVDEELASSDWEQELYRLGAGDAEVVFATVDEARGLIREWRRDDRPSILLTRDVVSMSRLSSGGLLDGAKVNLGGQHHGPEREEVLTYLHLSAADRADLALLAGQGVDVSAQDLPDATRVPLRTLFGG